MAADQRKRRLSSATAFGYGSPDQYRTKKRDLRSPQYDVNLNSHISLKWDDNGKRVVAKEDQIGISLRQLSSFVPAAPCSSSKLADVVTVPKEIFELNDLSEILSFEVWQSVLTEKERSYLLQFLPQGSKPDQVVQDLLAGDNFHFGNSFLKWSSSLCSGDLHPDAIIHHEKSLKANKKAYYSELQQYHVDMIRSLQNLKERCARSKDPEAEILLMMSRSGRLAEKSISPDSNGSRPRRPEENAAAISESFLADEKPHYNENQKLSAIRDTEIQKRIRNEDITKDRPEKLVTPASGGKGLPKPKKVEKLQKVNVNVNDGARYMSYVKISKKQHELFKSIKQSGSSMQSKALNRVLGNIDSVNVKPYAMFVEEEQKRIRDYWSNLAIKDVPAALQNWRYGQSERRHIMNSLLHELEEKLRPVMEDDKVVNCDLPQDHDEKLVSTHHGETVGNEETDGASSQGTSEHHGDDDSATQGSISDNEKESDPSSMQHESPVPDPPFNVNEGFTPSSDNQCSVENASLNVNEEFHLSSIENESSMHPLNVNKEFNPMDLNAENNIVTSETSDTCSTMPANHAALQTTPEHHAALQTTVACLNVHPQSVSAANAEPMSGPSLKNVWTSIGLPESFRHTPSIHYASSSEPPLRHPQIVPDQPARLIDLESDLPEEDATKDLLKRHTNHMPFFNPYPNSSRDKSELLHSLIKRDNYHHEQKKTGLEFHPTTNVLLEPSPFPSHFREQLQPPFPLDNRQKAQSELFMNQNIQDSIFSDNRYPVPGQGHFPAVNMRDWSNARIPPPPIQPSQLNSGELLNHNWFANENRAHSGWSGSDGPVFSSPSLGSGSSGDQSLYSVLSQCTTLRSRAPYNHVGSSEQIIPPTNYGQEMAGGIPMTSSNALPQTVSPFDYLSGNEAAATLKNTNMAWMSLGHQTPGLHDPSGKPFLKSWNP